MVLSRETRQKKIILDALRGTREHPTAAMVHHAVRADLPRLSLGTVYRVLGSLAEQEVIRRIEIPGEPVRFDADITAHQHIRCRGCGRVDDLPAREMPDFAKLYARHTTYEITGARLELSGYCPACRGRHKTGK